MGRTPHEQAQIEHRRQQVAGFYLTGWTQAAIARELNVSQATISSDLKAIRREWRDARVRDFDEAVGEELQKLRTIEREAWSGWQRSQEPVETTRVTQAQSGKKAERTVRQRSGDPRFLEMIWRASAARRALLGLDAPTRIAPTSPEGDEAYHAHVMRELSLWAERAGSGPTIVDGAYIARQLQLSADKNPAAAPSPVNPVPPEDHDS